MQNAGRRMGNPVRRPRRCARSAGVPPASHRVSPCVAVFLALLLVLTCAPGCRSVSVTPGAASQGEKRRVAVMPMDDSAAWRGVADYLFVGHTGARGGSELLGRALGTALAAQGFDVVPPDDVKRGLWEMKVDPGAAARADDALLRGVGERLKADALVTGRLTVCKRSWVLFCPWSSVEFSLRTIDPSGGALLWEASAKATRLWHDERALFADLSTRIAEKLTSPAP